MMKRHIILLFVALFSICILLGCNKEKTLHVYTWADYIMPELVEQFEKKFNCKVVIDTFDSNEAMYAKIKAGATGYDIITPTTYMVKVMYEQGMISDLNKAELPNLKHIDSEYIKRSPDKEMAHGVPYMCGSAGIAYNKKLLPHITPSWSVFDNPELKGRMTLFNDMRETIGAALKFLGYSLNTTDEKQLEEAKNIILRWKNNIAKFENEQYKTGVASGEFILVHGYSGDIIQVQESNPDIVFAVPQEGTTVSCDEFVIPKTSNESKLAHQFINFMHDPDNAAQNTTKIKWLCPNITSYSKLSPEILNNPAIFMSPETREKCEIIADLGVDNQKYTEIWDAVKSGMVDDEEEE